MSEAVELYEKDGRATGVYFCSTCRIVYATKKDADWCHGERICACGKTIKSMFRTALKCDDCDHAEWKEKERKKEAERFEAATKITEAEYKGEHVYLDDRYYESVEEAIDEYLEGQEPDYVWACTDHGIQRVDVEDVVSNIIENMWEDAGVDDLNGVEELEAALTAFNEANKGIQLWEPDYSRAILVQKGARA